MNGNPLMNKSPLVTPEAYQGALNKIHEVESALEECRKENAQLRKDLSDCAQFNHELLEMRKRKNKRL